MKIPKLNGLHLWLVKTSSYDWASLWITTSTRDSARASAKAVAFVRNEAGNRNLKVSIDELKYHGTIDA